MVPNPPPGIVEVPVELVGPDWQPPPDFVPFPEPERARLAWHHGDPVFLLGDLTAVPDVTAEPEPDGLTPADWGTPIEHWNIPTPEQPPAVLSTDAGEPLIYAGKVNWVSGEPGHGKGWVAKLAAVEACRSGQRVAYIDAEEGYGDLWQRMAILPNRGALVGGDFRHVWAQNIPGDDDGHHEHLDAIAEWVRGGLIVLDTAGSLSCPMDGSDVVPWLARWVWPLYRRDAGPTVIVCDHVPKQRKDRPRGPIGSQHKLAVVDGIALAVSGQPWTRTTDGRITLRLDKDKLGWASVPVETVIGGISGTWQDGAFHVAITAPDADDSPAEADHGDLVLEALLDAEPEGITSKRAVRAVIGRNNGRTDDALDRLTTAGLITMTRHGSANTYRITTKGTDAITRHQ